MSEQSFDPQIMDKTFTRDQNKYLKESSRTKFYPVEFKEKIEAIKSLAEDLIVCSFRKNTRVAVQIMRALFADIDRNWEETRRDKFPDLSEKQFRKVRKKVEKYINESIHANGLSGSVSRNNGRPKGSTKMDEKLNVSEDTLNSIRAIREYDNNEIAVIKKKFGPIDSHLEKIKPLAKKLRKYSYRGIEITDENSVDYALALLYYAKMVEKDREKAKDLVIEAFYLASKNEPLEEGRVPIAARCANSLGVFILEDLIEGKNVSFDAYNEASVWFDKAEDLASYWPTVQYNKFCLECLKGSQTDSKEEKEQYKKVALENIDTMCLLFESDPTEQQMKRFLQLADLTFNDEDMKNVVDEDVKKHVTEKYLETGKCFDDQKYVQNMFRKIGILSIILFFALCFCSCFFAPDTKKMAIGAHELINKCHIAIGAHELTNGNRLLAIGAHELVNDKMA